LQIIFAGKPELMVRLASPAMHSLNQRIGARALLKPLRPAEVHEYIDYRLRAKGGSARKIFASGALNYLVAHSGGIPRRVNVLSHNSMLRGFAASSKKVNLAMVKSAVSEYEDLIAAKATRTRDDAPARDARPGRRLVRATLAMTALALAAAGAMLVWSQARSAPNQMHATIGAAAIRPVAERVMTDLGIPLRPGASAPDASSFNVVLEPSRSKMEAPRPAHANGDSPLTGHR